jgi:hypothetical protein
VPGGLAFSGLCSNLPFLLRGKKNKNLRGVTTLGCKDWVWGVGCKGSISKNLLSAISLVMHNIVKVTRKVTSS